MIPSERLLPMPALEDKVGLKRTKIYGLIQAGDLPPGKTIHGARLWRESEIDAWIERTWASADLCQGGNKKASTSVTSRKAEPPLKATAAVPPMPVSVYWPSSYLLERYGRSKRTLNLWQREKGFPAPAIQGGHGAQSRWHADDVLAWETQIRQGKAKPSKGGNE
ncbi:AlpA family transcriptional regulator [Halomonas alkaliantarctica]|nr:AlpA family transcriptional regulator [Halomonas alkaliantarctica]